MRMARKKRIKSEEEDTPSHTRPKSARRTRQSNRITATDATPSAQKISPSTRKRKFPSEDVEDDEAGDVSDSSSLTEPPLIISPPTPPKLAFPHITNGAMRKPAQVKKASAKEHEEALNIFVRDDSDDEEMSDESTSTPQPNGIKSDHSENKAESTEDEDEEDWEEVDLSNQKQVSVEDLNETEQAPDLEVTLERTQHSMRIKNKSSSAAERKIRMHTHLLHVLCLLVHGAGRNNWLNDQELQKDLLSQFPDLQKRWKRYLKSTPDKDTFLDLLDITSRRFRESFTISKPGLRKKGYRDLSLIDKERAKQVIATYEKFENIETFKQSAKEMTGSRDFAAQLFTAFLRGLGVETRLVFSLQPLGFNFGRQEDFHRLDRKKDNLDKDINKQTPEKPKELISKKRKRRKSDGEGSAEEDLGLPKISGRGGSQRKTRQGPDSDLLFPVFWSEVCFENQWIPIDAIVLQVIAADAKLVEQFEPKGKIADDKKQVMGYVVAYDADRFAKDVTVRYVKNFPGKAKRWRVREFSVRGIDGQTYMYDWFKRSLGPFRRNEKTERDEIEDVELAVKPPEPKEVNIDSLSYYKSHPKYVLERHLRREEALRPGSKPVRTFISGKGEKAREEIVYNRSDLYICRTVENWYKEGKVVKEGEVPMKQVKARPMTLNRKREHEMAMAENDDQPIMEGLYAAHQVELFRPPPIENGVIPKNAYGNIDLFVDSMLPEGAVYLPYRGTAKIAKKLGIDFSEAITGFEFKNRRAIPVVSGVVVAEEHEDMVLDAWHAEEALRLEKEATKKQKEILARWKKFLVGLRIRKRIGLIYGAREDGNEGNAINDEVGNGKHPDVKGGSIDGDNSL